MGDGTASAIPSDLTHWATWASGLNKSLDSMGKQVNQAIEDFNSGAQEPRFIGHVDQVGNDVIGYAARNGVIDEWVGKVGQAFIQADHKGVPPQIYRADHQDFITGLNTASEADLARLVGADPTKQANDAANGAALAAQLKQAEDAKDEDQFRTILSRLKGQSQEFAYAFFNELGPDQTIKTLIPINQMNDDGLLRTFDKALGQASQHPGWDPNFTSALLDPRRGAWGYGRTNTSHVQLSMLKYGTFSEDFLTQSADYFLFSHEFPTIDSDEGLVVFDALDQNPNAAYDYLTGHYQVGGENLPRVQYLLGYSTRAYPTGENKALGNLIAHAGFSDNGRADNGNQLLQVIGSIDNPNGVPDDIRPGIEILLAHYIGNFPTDTPPSHLLGQLFMIAGSNADGSFDPGRTTNLQNAVTKWLFDSKPPQNPDQMTDWAKKVGLMTHDLIQPLITQQRAKDDSEAAGRTFAISAGTALATTALAAIPGVDAATLGVAGAVFTTYILTAQSKAESDQQTIEKMQEKTVKATMIINLAQHGMLNPPVDLSKSVSLEKLLNHQRNYHITLPDGSSRRLDEVTGDAGDQSSPYPNK